MAAFECIGWAYDGGTAMPTQTSITSEQCLWIDVTPDRVWVQCAQGRYYAEDC